MKKILAAVAAIVGCGILAASGAGTKGTLNVYLLTGQSNSLGAVKGSPLSKEDLASHATTTADAVYWHENFQKNGGVYAGASTSWEAVAPAAPATPPYSNTPCMGPEYGFAWMLARKPKMMSAKLGRPFGIIKASLDGGGNGYWEAGGNGWSKIIAAAGRAVTQALKDGYTRVNFVGVIYLQGESNNAAEAAAAGERITALPERLRSALAALSPNVTFSDDFHVAVGEPANWVLDNPWADTATSGKLRAAATAVPKGKTKPFGTWIPTRDLAKITSGDRMKVHYDGQSQLTIGARYAYAEAMRLGYKETDAIRNGDYDAPLGTAAAYYAGAVPAGKTVVWDVSSAALSTVGSGGVRLHGLKFDSDGGNYLQSGATLIRGGGTLTVGAGGVRAAKNVNITAPVRAGANQTWTVEDGCTLAFGGAVAIAKNAGLSLSIGKNATLAMAVSGDMTFTSVSNSGTLRLDLASGNDAPRISVRKGTVDPRRVSTNIKGLTYESSSDGKSIIPRMPARVS